MHVAKFELGAPQLNPLPAPLDVQMKLTIHAHVRTPWAWESHGWKAGQNVPTGIGSSAKGRLSAGGRGLAAQNVQGKN